VYPTVLCSRSPRPAAPLVAQRVTRSGEHAIHLPCIGTPVDTCGRILPEDRPDIDYACITLKPVLTLQLELRSLLALHNAGPHASRRLQPLHALVLRPTGMHLSLLGLPAGIAQASAAHRMWGFAILTACRTTATHHVHMQAMDPSSILTGLSTCLQRSS